MPRINVYVCEFACLNFSKSTQFEHNKPLLIPAGQDSLQQIGKFLLMLIF